MSEEIKLEMLHNSNSERRGYSSTRFWTVYALKSRFVHKGLCTKTIASTLTDQRVEICLKKVGHVLEPHWTPFRIILHRLALTWLFCFKNLEPF